MRAVAEMGERKGKGDRERRTGEGSQLGHSSLFSKFTLKFVGEWKGKGHSQQRAQHVPRHRGTPQSTAPSGSGTLSRAAVMSACLVFLPPDFGDHTSPTPSLWDSGGLTLPPELIAWVSM